MGKQILLLISMLALFAGKATAGKFTYTSKLQGSALTNGAVLETVDDQYLAMTGTSTAASWHNLNKNRSADNFIHLKYTGAGNVHYNADWSVQVSCQVERWDEFGVLQPLESCVLKIDYKTAAGSKYTDISTFKSFNAGGHRVRVTVVSITISSSLPLLPADVLLENVIDVERAHFMDSAAPIKITHTGGGAAGCSTFTGADMLEFKWDYLEGAEEYDFEWVFKSDYDLDQNIDFADASRITTSNQHYEISATFDQGKIYYRIRGIAKDFATGKQRLEGAWTQGGNYLQVCNKEKRNWTYKSVYAEEGKRKEVRTFFDGSGRTRQSVTVSNTEGVSLVAENIYDYEGRPAVQTLPAPSRNFRGDLKFYQKFNLNTAGIPYSKKDFDTDALSACATTTLTPGMSSSAANGDGASLYYSENNLLVNPGAASVLPDNGFNALIPDADDYPFMQTVYSNDGSVKLQSGVGPTHAIKSGHETQYFNATAGQAKLDRLFGNEVGYAEHYQEKVVVDPNGQVSVSYENLSGQVIATALRGFAPDNLMELGPDAAEEKYTAPELVQEQFTNQYDPASESYISLTNFMVSKITTPYDFSYTISPQVFNTICDKHYACKYLLKITITDDCGNSIAEESGAVISPPLSTPVLDKVHKIDAANFSTGAFQATFSVKFPHLGVYRIEKKLSLDPDGLTDALEDFEHALRNGCIKPLSAYETEYEAGVDMTECMTCEEVCDFEAQQIDWSLYTASNPYIWDDTHSFANANDFIAFCKSQCRPEIPKKDCEGLLAALKDDMSPGGQYFEATLSGFVDGAKNYTLTAPNNYFFDALIAMQTGNPLDPSYKFINKWNAYIAAHGCKPLPVYSGSWHSDLTSSWDPCWEDFLAQYHPEYCRWQRCTTLTTSYDFDADLLRAGFIEATTTQPAAGNPYLNTGVFPVGKTVLDKDPYFTTIKPADKGLMQSELSYCASCVTQFPVCPTCPITTAPPTNSMWDWATVAPSPITATPGTPAWDEARWSNFQKLYIAVKAQYVKAVGCNALPDTDFPPDNMSNLPGSLGIGTSTGGHTLQLNGMTINDPEPLDNFQTIISNINVAIAANPNNPNLTPYNNVPQLCLYNSSKASITINPRRNPVSPAIPLNAACTNGIVVQCAPYSTPVPVSDNTYVFYVNIKQIPKNYPLDNTATNWSNANCYVRISDPVTLPDISNATSVSDISAYLNQIKNAIDNYQSKPYDFTCAIHPPATAGGSYSYDIVAPSSLGPLGNPANLEWSIEMTSSDGHTVKHCSNRNDPMDFSVATKNCDFGQVFAPNCLCIEFEQALTFYNAKDAQNNFIVDHTTYPTPADYIAANLSQDGITVTTANVLFWMGNCDANSNISPLELDNNGAIANTQGNDGNPIPEKLKCEEPCQQQGMDEADFYALEAFDGSVYLAMQNFIVEYKAACLNAPALDEIFQVRYYEKEYHYTLYYYDQADNLVRTVPPNAVKRIPPATLYAAGINQVHYARLHANDPTPPALIFPGHSRAGQNNPGAANLMVTNYKYNTLNQLVEQETPDGGLSQFWYNDIGQLRFSQNAKQKAKALTAVEAYSYTNYDGQGRIIEVGENTEMSVVGPYSTYSFAVNVNNPLFPTLEGTEVTKTYYDQPLPSLPFTQSFLRKRVSSVTYEDVEDASDLTFNSASHYNYDAHGNVNLLVQDYPDLRVNGNQYKKIYYKYDLISGNVNEVQYQPHQFDEYYHRYEYDANNRITHAYTSNDHIHWQQDARYFYYLHGPLARVEIGEEKVQGLDYAYTLQGWIKAVNSNTLSDNYDPGKDGYAGAWLAGQNDIHKNTARDVFGYSLEYYNGDYTSIAANPLTNNNWSVDITGSISQPSGTTPYSATPDLFNGNIKAMATAMYQPAAAAGALPLEMNTIARFFEYDQLNRIREAQSYLFVPTATALNGIAPYTSPGTNDYYESFRYDANGNILNAVRNGPSGISMDDMTYQYYDLTKNNQLARVGDNVPDGNYSEDIDDQTSPTNYEYDPIGNLTGDEAEGIVDIDWSVYGKILKIYKGGIAPNIEFRYDPSGNRIQKIVKPKTRFGEKTQEDWTTTYYVRDAQGNVMAIYDRKMSVAAGTVQDQLLLTETPVYGSSRLGLEEQDDRAGLTQLSAYVFGGYKADGTIISGVATTPPVPVPRTLFDHILGNKRYELSNHLGNVNVVISDRKLSVANAGGGHDHYLADVVSSTDYYAFGAPMVGRAFSSDAYRYGFNGKENDDEVKGVEGSQQDYGMRVYDPRLGKFLSVDPLSGIYSWLSPYQFAGNMPIYTTDINGLEPEKILNEGERLLGTPYEWGGKNPAPQMVGFLLTKEGEKYWNETLMPYLKVIYKYYPNNYEQAGCEITEKKADYTVIMNGIYKAFSFITANGSLGIDCSGYVLKCYKQDATLLMSINADNFTGTTGQLDRFKTAEKRGQAYVHNDFNLLSAGDVIIIPKKHIMIATGNVKVNKDGKVISYETLEANSTAVGSVKKWRDISDNPNNIVIGHPFRTTDATSFATSFFDFDENYNPTVKEFTPKERTEYNKIQTKVEE